MIYFKEHYVTVCYSELLKLVEVEWHGTLLSHQYRETLELVLSLIEEKKIENFLVNRKDMVRISLMDEQWREQEWYPRLLRSSVKRIASVCSKDYFNEVSISKLIEEKDRHLKIERQNFNDYRSAKNWLLQSRDATVPPSKIP